MVAGTGTGFGAGPVIGDIEGPSQSFTEKTEPFSQSEIDARMRGIRVRQESFIDENTAPVHLDELVVPPDKDIRILVRPLRSRSVSPGSHDNCEWLALRAEVAEPEGPDQSPGHRVLAVTQTSKDINFSVRVPPGNSPDSAAQRATLWCELYYDPASDDQILVNKSDIPISLKRLSQNLPSSPGPGPEVVINPLNHRTLTPGTWRIKVDDIDVLDFRVLEKRPAVLQHLSTSSSSLSEMVNSSGKRSFVADEDDPLGPETRRIRGPGYVSPGRRQDGVIEFLPPRADRLVFPLPGANKRNRELTTVNGQALLKMENGDTIDVPGGFELDHYRLSKREPIASTPLTSVFKGTVSDHPKVPPDSVITVKVLKTRPPANSSSTAAAAPKPHEIERNVIRQAEGWLREYKSQEYLQHERIVRLYAGDARHLSLYMEHIDAHDLTIRPTWRLPTTDYFVGDRRDAERILRDVAGALHYIHGRTLVHNDIKPSNILYSAERGAVLCDFGLSTHTRGPSSAGGTPWYVPPEFIALKQRGPPGDVWALGVTMLYVLRKLPWPESRGSGKQHNRPLFWRIADVNKPVPQKPLLTSASTAAAAGAGNKAAQTQQQQQQQPPSAVDLMRLWLGEVAQAREKLNPQDKLQALVADMLAAIPSQRITMRRVMNELAQPLPQDM